ncbi:hypothetical protein K9M79_02890 [Candidatus Woesearchaeota archaeon]|nr:hypothetical protein [Candidatus Woesearchaeota archaeon]
MLCKIHRLTRVVEGQTESRIYVKTPEGYSPLTLNLEQTEEFMCEKNEEIGEIDIPHSVNKKIVV